MKLKLTLAAITVGLMVSLAANAYLYAQQNALAPDGTLQKQIADLDSQLANLHDQGNSIQSEKAILAGRIADLEVEVANLHNQTNTLQNENSNLKNETTALQKQVDQISQNGFPKIVTRLGTTDVRSTPAAGHPWSGVTRFYISGEIWNVGTGVAQNCRLHVTLYQGSFVANDTYLELGTINAGSFADIAANIYYTGAALTSWTLIPEYS